MTNTNKKALQVCLVASLRFAIDDRHVEAIVDSLLDEVANDIDNPSAEDYVSEDVRRSLGRVFE